MSLFTWAHGTLTLHGAAWPVGVLILFVAAALGSDE